VAQRHGLHRRESKHAQCATRHRPMLSAGPRPKRPLQRCQGHQLCRLCGRPPKGLSKPRQETGISASAVRRVSRSAWRGAEARDTEERMLYKSSSWTLATCSHSSTARSAFNCGLLALYTRPRLGLHTLRRCISSSPSAVGELNSNRPSFGLSPCESPPKIIFLVTAALRSSRCVPSARRTKRAFLGSSRVTLSLMAPVPRSFQPRSLPSPTMA
jgi:hypothetical protein